MTKPIQITKRAGEILNRESVLNQLEARLGTLRNGEYTLSLSRQEKRRTLAENRTFWMWMACMEKETGTPKEDFHDYYCTKFLRRRVSIGGEDRTVISGTSKLNTVQFSNLLDKIQSDASTEFGIKLPNPDDLYWEEFEMYYKKFI
jgi:hypothetical protein